MDVGAPGTIFIYLAVIVVAMLVPLLIVKIIKQKTSPKGKKHAPSKNLEMLILVIVIFTGIIIWLSSNFSLKN